MLPVLLGLLALIVDFGRLVADYHAVAKGVRSAARYLARVDGGPAGLAIDCTTQTLNENAPVLAAARRLAMTGRIDGDPAREGIVATWRAAQPSAAATGITVTVRCAQSDGGVRAGAHDGAVLVPGIAVTASVPFRFTLARAFGLGPELRFSVVYRTVHMGI